MFQSVQHMQVGQSSLVSVEARVAGSGGQPLDLSGNAPTTVVPQRLTCFVQA